MDFRRVSQLSKKEVVSSVSRVFPCCLVSHEIPHSCLEKLVLEASFCDHHFPTKIT